MKPLKTLVFLLAVISFSLTTNAQSITDKASKRALLLADSLVNAYRDGNWDSYLAMSYPGMVKYYGGRQGFREYIQRSRAMNQDMLEESPEKVQVIQIANESKEWQCVLRRSRESIVDGKKALIISYLIGQSTDEGNSWKYVDIACNSAENVVYIMPDVFNTLSIPQRQVVYEKDFAKFEVANLVQ